MNFTVEELELQLKSDGNLFNGETNMDYDNIVYMLWYEEQPDIGILDVLGIGEFRIVDTAWGKNGPITYSDGYNSWEEYIVLERDGRFFKLTGSYNSWDSNPWNGKVLEVKKTIVETTVWK